jgi:hypothetical protein
MNAAPDLTMEPVIRDERLHRCQRRRHLPCGDEAESANHRQQKRYHENLDHVDSFHMLLRLIMQYRERRRILRLRALQPLVTVRQWTRMFTFDSNCG